MDHVRTRSKRGTQEDEDRVEMELGATGGAMEIPPAERMAVTTNTERELKILLQQTIAEMSQKTTAAIIGIANEVGELRRETRELRQGPQLDQNRNAAQAANVIRTQGE